MVLSGKLSVEPSLCSPCGELGVDHLGDELLGLDERNLNVAVRVTVERELSGYAFGQRFEGSTVFRTQVLHDVAALRILVQVFIVGSVSSQEVVEFLNEPANGGHKFDEALGNEHHAEVLSLFCTMGYGRCDVFDDVVEGLIFSLNFFRDDADIGLCLQSAFQSDVRGRTPHEFNEVPVFAGRITVAFDVADELAVGFCGRIEAEGGFDLVVLEVAVDGLGTTDHLHAVVLGGIIFGQDASVGIGVVAADDDDGPNVELADNFEPFFKLFGRFELGASATDHVKSTGVAIVVEEVGRNFDIVVIHESAGPHEESVQTVVGVEPFHLVEESGDDVMSAGSLSAAQNDTHVDGFSRGFVARNKFHKRHAVCMGEEFFDFFLIVYTLCGGTFTGLNCTLKCFRKFGLVGSSRFLQCTFFHFVLNCFVCSDKNISCC